MSDVSSLHSSRRAVFLTACDEIAARFVERGFRYAKSGLHISRQTSGFTYNVRFASNHHEPGVDLDLTVNAGVRSSDLRRWRKQHWPAGTAPSDGVAGGMLQNLGVAMPLASWNIIDPNARPFGLDEIAQAIERAALPYFSLFDDVDALIRRLEIAPVASFPPLSTIEWLLSRGRRDSALRHGRLVLEDAELRQRYVRACARIERGERGLLPYAMEPEGLAYAALAYELEL